jgi:hypothetical protein
VLTCAGCPERCRKCRTRVNVALAASIGVVRAEAEAALPDVGDGAARGWDARCIVHLHQIDCDSRAETCCFFNTGATAFPIQGPRLLPIDVSERVRIPWATMGTAVPEKFVHNSGSRVDDSVVWAASLCSAVGAGLARSSFRWSDGHCQMLLERSCKTKIMGSRHEDSSRKSSPT